MVRPVLFVAPSMRIIDLLVRMRISGDHMALVVDEYGGTDGLITLEDVFEEIVGEIQDEHDEVDTNQAIIPVKENVYEADARVRVDQLEETLGIELSKEDREEDFDTLGGLIFFTLGRVPARGELIEYNSSFSFEVIDVDPRRIKKVRIARLNASPANEIANRA
jgi:CBS domain containing-hemolysin-like protein